MMKKPVRAFAALALLLLWLPGGASGARSDTSNPPGTESYTITATADAGGGIIPSGTLLLPASSDLAFTITPDTGFDILDVLVDGHSLGRVSAYIFRSVQADHTLEAAFIKHDDVCPGRRFTDVDTGKWYHEGIDFVLEAGLFGGTSESTFEPDAAMTGAMLVTVLYRLENVPASAGPRTFGDVKSGAWYKYAVAWAAANGIAEGYGADAFSPEDPATREQTAVILYRYAGYKGYDTTAAGSLSDFTDAGGVSDWALATVKWAVAEGLITGVRDNALEPDGTTSRAQAAAILMRFLKDSAPALR